MLRLVRADGDQARPSALVYTPWSVPAAIRSSAKAKTRTLRPSRPAALDHVAPASRLTRAPPPRVPASTRRAVYGLKLTLLTAVLPAWTVVHAVPPAALLKSDPCELAAITTWLLEGSTASAKSAVLP